MGKGRDAAEGAGESGESAQQPQPPVPCLEGVVPALTRFQQKWDGGDAEHTTEEGGLKRVDRPFQQLHRSVTDGVGEVSQKGEADAP